MRVLVGCECSGVVRRAFAARGHDAWSCDIKPAEDNSPNHIQDDLLKVIPKFGADLGIFHPECKYLANSGVQWLTKEAGRRAKMIAAARFFNECYDADIPMVAVENSIMHGSAAQLVPSYDQIVQPWWFGHMESKAIVLWLKNLPLLKPTNNVYEQMMKLPVSKRNRVHHERPGPERSANRARFLPGPAEAMADQWGSL